MRAIGLGVFTTGDFIAWMNQRKPDNPGVYKNRHLIRGLVDDDGNAIANPFDVVLGVDNEDDTDDEGNKAWGSWLGWRRDRGTGRYEKQYVDSWNWSFEGADITYTDADLFYWPHWSLNGLVSDGVEIVSQTDTSIVLHIDDVADSNNVLTQVEELKTPSKIVNIIQLNRFINDFKLELPKSDWKKTNFDHLKILATDKYITDIKGSKFGYVDFYADITFVFDLAEGGIQCDKTDRVNFRLYLYDDAYSRGPAKEIILKQPKFAGYKTDALGRSHGGIIDGEFQPVDVTNPKQQSVGELQKAWNPYTKKWESGTQNMMAKTVHDIDAAFNNPTVDSLIDSNVKQDLDGDPNRHFVPSSGLVMPIEMQNGNPMQWQPNYASPPGCREDNHGNKKAQVIAFNFNPLKAYEKDTLVMLSQIGGVWHISDMGSGVAPKDKPVEAVFDGKWEFTYAATNSNSFFKVYDSLDAAGLKDRGQLVQANSEGPALFAAGPQTKAIRESIQDADPLEMERSFHLMYYFDDELNNHTIVPATQTKPAKRVSGVTYNDQFSTIGQKRLFSMNGWYQFTSFDFMDRNIAGNRTVGNALATTQARLNAANKDIPEGNFEGEPWPQAGHSGPFFGCVFPDGYSLNDTRFYVDGRNWVVSSESNQYTNSAQTNLYADAFFGYEPNLYTTAFDGDTLPFSDPDTGADLDPPVYKPTRSINRRSVADANPEVDLTEDGKNTYQRNSAAYEPSMFFMSEQGKHDLKMLPADIATNASPDGENGGPIQNIHALDRLHGIYTGEPLRLRAKVPFLEKYWLRKNDPVGTATNDKIFTNKNESAFDFKPKTPTKIQFRPLKMGTYAQFYPNSHTNAEMYRGEDLYLKGIGRSAIVNGNDAEITSRAAYSAEVNRLLFDTDAQGEGAASNYSKGREGILIDHRHRKYIYDDKKGLLYNSDITFRSANYDGEAKPQFFEADEVFGKGGQDSHIDFPSYSSRIHTIDFWNGDPEKHEWQAQVGGRDGDGAGAYGVIGAIATATFNNSVTFDTSQRVGMGSESSFNGGMTNRKTVQKPTWGGSNRSNYDDHATTQLWATIYGAWPRDQLIYDVRYFCVHHFNEYPLLEGLTIEDTLFETLRFGDPSRDSLGNFPYRDTGAVKVAFPRRIDNTLNEFYINLIHTRALVRDADGELVETPLDTDGDGVDDLTLYQIDHANRTFDVDLISPTRFGPDGKAAETCATGCIVYSDATIEEGEAKDKMLLKKYWNIDTRRVGKLLPYRYNRTMLTMPFPSGKEIRLDDPNFVILRSDLPEEGLQANDPLLRNKLVLIGSGSNYRVGDLVGNAGKGLRMGVTEVTSAQIDGETVNGIISKVKVFNPADKVEFTHASPSETLITRQSQANALRVTTISSIDPQNAGGFEGFFTNAMVSGITEIDQKPLFIDGDEGRFIQLSANSDSTSTQIREGAQNNPRFGFTDTPNLKSVSVQEEQRSPNRKYDIFFHFHNDITHTFADSEYGGFLNGGDGISILAEQFIETKISGT